jgi:DNA-binding GntR family transcriptional regulator
MSMSEPTRPRRAIPTGAIKAEIARLIEAGRMNAGERLTEVKIASAAGLSRAPIRRAMEELAAEGVLEARETRGFSLRVGWADPSWQALRDATGPEEAAYLRIAMDRFRGQLPDAISENAVATGYGLGKAETSRVLTRMAREGWIEKRAGYGWQFLPTFPTRDVYLQGYRFRQLVEPAALLEPGFALGRDVLDGIEAGQRAVLDGIGRGISFAAIFEAGCAFHEGLMRASRNAFMLDAVERVNRMRRLVEFRALDAAIVRRQTAEHLAILDALRLGDRARASTMLAAHLGGASAAKLDRLALGSPAPTF